MELRPLFPRFDCRSLGRLFALRRAADSLVPKHAREFKHKLTKRAKELVSTADTW
jgi:hypothetical protein